MEKSRILLTNLNSLDVIHEDSLNFMKIIPSAIHNWFRATRNNLPWPFSALRFWLLIDSNAELERVLNEFKSRSKTMTKKEKAVIGNLPVTSEGMKQTADDQWEKEDIEAIQGTATVIISLNFIK